MTWHANHQMEEGSMCHPSDMEAWRHFDQTHPNFAVEPRNIRLDLCTDGFAPHEQYSRTYSCWPVILIPYNLPPGMCMSSEYMFLTMVILAWPFESKTSHRCLPGAADRGVAEFMACGCTDKRQCEG
ncbi:UNVERIFIED_CONTAM: hypothetical protein Slati_1336000 [Sesamum latifolium]|uniref:Uncharacterized protein n=1 Tax=Sesamum latifolium TaxID=2727402 RepID=A0AAW2XI57_9LAMI